MTVIDTGPAESPTTQKINAIGLEDLIAGVNKRQKLRRFKEWVDEKILNTAELPDGPQKEIEKSRIARLENAQMAKDFSTDCVLAWDDAAYAQKIALMNQHGVVFLQHQMEIMAERNIMKTSQHGKTLQIQDWEACIESTLPDPTGDDDEWNSACPKTREILATDDALVKFTQSMVIKYFIKPVLAKVTRENLEATIQLFEDFGNRFVQTTEQASKAMVHSAMNIAGCFRACIHVLQVHVGEYFEEFKELTTEEEEAKTPNALKIATLEALREEEFTRPYLKDLWKGFETYQACSSLIVLVGIQVLSSHLHRLCWLGSKC